MRGPASLLFLAPALLMFLPTGRARAQEAAVRLEDDVVYFNFQDAPLDSAFESISEVLGINYVIGGDIGGTITMRTRHGIPAAEVPSVLDTILRSHGLSLTRSGDFFVVTGPQGAGTAVATAGGERRMFVHFLRNADAVDMANLLVALFGGETGRFRSSATLTGRSLSSQLEGFRLQPGEGVILPPEDRVRTPEALTPAAPQGAVAGDLVGGVTIVPDERTNSLVIRTAPENYETLRSTIETLDVRPQQVLIEVVIAEVTLDDRTQFGINFAAFFREDDVEGRVQNFNPDNLPLDSLGFTASVFDPGDVRAVLRALATDDRLNVLSTPRIVASNNQEARILIGSEVPFVQISSFGGVSNTVLQSVQFRDVGLELTVIPRINQDREVTLDILQQNSSVSTASFGNIDAPLITSREAQTTLVVGDRRTVVLGGLIETQEQRRESGIPLLRDIPLLGYLFKSVDRSTMKSELIITMTPYIIGSDAEAEILRGRLQDEWRRFEADPGAFDPGDDAPERPPTDPPVDAEIRLEPR